jgi:hypothetical protein
MSTPLFQNWLAKTKECGFSNEQACGLAMLYAWNLTYRKSENETQNPDSYWTFMDQKKFNDLNENSFVFQDFIEIAPEFKLAGELLRTRVPKERQNSSGEAATFFNLSWPDESPSETNINDLLLFRHRFDSMWCQRIGESLRLEIRTPLHAFAFANSVTHGFNEIDPLGFTYVLNAILKKLSPLAWVFTNPDFLKNTNGLADYEPFQLALTGFSIGIDPIIAEPIWNLQRLLFYKQPSGQPTNLEKQNLPLESFTAFAAPITENFININKDSYVPLNRNIASEYIYRASNETKFSDQLRSLLQKRYGFTTEIGSEDKSLSLVINAAAFDTICSLQIRNITNRNLESIPLYALDDVGLLWGRDLEQPIELRDEAFNCFDVMLSWRQAASWGLFLETQSGFIQRAYIGDTSEYEEVENLFAKICTAYSPSRCFVALWTHQPETESDPSVNSDQVIFASFNRTGPMGVYIFEGVTDNQEGRSLGEYLGYSTDEAFCNAYFQKVRDCMLGEVSEEISRAAQIELLQVVEDPKTWNFMPNEIEIWSTDESTTYADIGSVTYRTDKTLMWLLIDYLEPQTISEVVTFKSSRVLFEFDCKNQMRKVVSIEMFEEQMGAGNCVHASYEVNEVATAVPPPGNVGHKAWELACELYASNASESVKTP